MSEPKKPEIVVADDGSRTCPHCEKVIVGPPMKFEPALSEVAALRSFEPITHVAILFDRRLWSLPRPYRHHHLIQVIRYLDPFIEHVDGTQGFLDAGTQGFLDASGKFLTREQARLAAEANGQIRGGRLIGTVLTSEDLW